MENLKGKVVLITGSSIGIGVETALKFAQEGCRVVVTYFKDKKEAEEVGKKCKDLGAEDILVLQLNLLDDESIKVAVKSVIEKYGVIDILINNAGVITYGNLRKLTFEDIENQVRTNLEGLIKITREWLSYIKETIINIGSGAGISGYGGLATYSATKFAVRGFTKSLAQELSGINVYVVNPGTTATKMTGFAGQDPKDVAEVILKACKGEYNVPSGSDINVWEVT